MAEIWGAAIVAGAAIYSSSQQKSAANKASKAQQGAASSAIQATQQNYDNTAANLNPYIDAGKGALGQMQTLNSGDYSSFKASPDYQFTLDQGLQGLDRGAAARGSLYSGGHSADVLNYAGGLASQEYGKYYSRIAGLAENGQNAASNLGSVGTGNAAAIGNASTNAANAQANAAYNTANANSNTVGQLANLAGTYATGQPSPTASSYTLGGSGTSPYSGINNGQYNANGGFNLATAGTGVNHG